MKKGLRHSGRSALTFRIVRTDDLMKKGLRRDRAGNAAEDGGFEPIT